MKLLLAIHNFPPEFTGGTERVVLALAQVYARRGVEVAVLTGSEAPWQGTDVVASELAGVRVLRVARQLPEETYGLDLARPRLARVVAGILRRERPDCLHVHHWSTLHHALVRQAAALGIRAGVTLHDLWTGCPRFFRRPPQGIRCPAGAGRHECIECVQRDLPGSETTLAAAIAARDAEVRAELGAARFIATPSAATEARLRLELDWPTALAVVPHGVLESAHGTAPLPQPGEPLRIGTFGNLLREKGVDLLLEACGGLQGIELHVFGPFLEGDLAPELERRAAELRVPYFAHGRFTPGAAHPATQLHLAVFPSRCHETYGLVVDEALAHGLPVVVSDRGALAERIGEGGLVARGGLEPLRTALARVLRDPGLLAQLRAGIPRLGSIDDAAAQYLQLFGAER